MKRETWKATQATQDSPQGDARSVDHDSPEAREARRLADYKRAAKLAEFFPNPNHYQPYNPF